MESLKHVLQLILKVNLLQCLPILALCTSMGTVFLCYSLTLYYHYEFHQTITIYISGTGLFFPERSIFSIGLTLTGCMLMVMCIIVYFIYEHTEDTNKNRIVNIIFLFSAISSGCMLSCLSCFNYIEWPAIHSISASSFFFASVGVQVCSIFQTKKRLLRYPRAAICMLSFFLAFSYNILPLFGPLVALFGPPVEESTDLLIEIAAILEWCCVGTLLCYYLTFTYEFGKYEISISKRISAEKKAPKPKNVLSSSRSATGFKTKGSGTFEETSVELATVV